MKWVVAVKLLERRVRAVVELVELGEFWNTDARSFRVTIPDSVAKRAALADLVALELARELCRPSDEAFGAWLTRFQGGEAPDEVMKKVLAAHLMADFENPDDETRLEGAVVEQLWAVMAPELDGGWGCPVYVEPGHTSVIDHGGDGLSLYEMTSDPDLRFRLWESKRHAGKTAVTATITKAAGQLDERGTEYLARLSKPLQTHDDERVRRLAGLMTKLWVQRDDRTAVGVSVGKASAGTIPKRPFRGLAKRFDYDEVERREGLIIEITDLNGFANDVRTRLLKGIE